jgi:hypothetical protein
MTTRSPKTFVAGEALEAYRRVKLDASGNVVYSDAGEGYIGFTLELVASGSPVAVVLKNDATTFKVTAAEAFAIAAVLYGADDGKVQDTAAGNQIGTALEAATADGDVVEALADLGAGAQVNGAGVLKQADGEPGSIPILLHKQGITDATTSVTIATPAFDVRIVDWWLISRDTTASNIKLVNDATDMTAVKAKGTADDAIVRGGDIIEAQRDVAAGDPIKVNASVAAAFDIFVMAIKV